MITFQISDVEKVNEYEFTFTLTTDSIALFVWLEGDFWANGKGTVGLIQQN